MLYLNYCIFVDIVIFHSILFYATFYTLSLFSSQQLLNKRRHMLLVTKSILLYCFEIDFTPMDKWTVFMNDIKGYSKWFNCIFVYTPYDL